MTLPLLNHVLNKTDKTYIHTHAENLMRRALIKYHAWLVEQGLDLSAEKQNAGWVNVHN